VREPLNWSRDGLGWPHQENSRFVGVGGLHWHVQRLGPRAAPQLVLIHGTGASSHSWRTLAPLLAQGFGVVWFDLPGHAFTHTPPEQDLSLPGMARAVGELLAVLKLRPALLVGHSAGAAVAAQLVLDRTVAPQAVAAINGALLPLHGVAGQVFSPLARLLAAQPLVPRLFAWNAGRRSVVQRLIDGTGSRLDAEGMRLYGRLVGDAGHAAGALRMMASWDLQGLAQRLPSLPVPLHLVAGALDRTVPDGHSARVHRMVPGSTLTLLQGLGHLAHEENAAAVAAALASALHQAAAKRPPAAPD
jgi:magnesium chelatase accessory protein